MSVLLFFKFATAFYRWETLRLRLVQKVVMLLKRQRLRQWRQFLKVNAYGCLYREHVGAYYSLIYLSTLVFCPQESWKMQLSSLQKQSHSILHPQSCMLPEVTLPRALQLLPQLLSLCSLVLDRLLTMSSMFT